MSKFIAKQPNGLYCRFSTVVYSITHYNMTFDDYVELLMKLYGKNRRVAEKEAEDTIKNYMIPFQEVIDSFLPYKNTEEEFRYQLKEMGYEQWKNVKLKH